MKMSKIRCDNGREYINNKVTTWCKEKEIEIDNTTPHTPQLKSGKTEQDFDGKGESNIV